MALDATLRTFAFRPDDDAENRSPDRAAAKSRDARASRGPRDSAFLREYARERAAAAPES